MTLNSLYFLVLWLLLIMFFFLNNSFFYLEFCLTSFPPMELSLVFQTDFMSLSFLITVSVIFTMVLIYTMAYMSTEVYLKRFSVILSLFVLSMFILILSSNLFTALIGWDGLGVSSLFLILFYFSNSSMKAGMLTFLMNRVGDCLFIMTLTNTLLMGESMMFHLTNFESSISFLFILVSLTKSAQIPFSSWLPAAMEAPTPVSSLVHSSTLVTAGIYMLLRYPNIWLFSEFSLLLTISSVSTCMMAALSALVESDLKKLIALSTLSQLGFIMFGISIYQLSQSFMHMLMHAYFKALLFLSAGLLIHSFKGTQSIQQMSLSKNQSPLVVVIMSISILAMMGMPFLSGFYSKDMILDSLYMSTWSLLVVSLMVMSFILTSIYSIRMIWYLLNSMSTWNSMSDSDLGMIKPMLPLVVMSLVGGSMFTWLSMDVKAAVNSSKVMILAIITISVVSYWIMDMTAIPNWFLESKWFLTSFNSVLSKTFFEKMQIYAYSADLSGLPEVMNNSLVSNLKAWGEIFKSLEKLYLSNVELVMFSIVMSWITFFM